MTGISRNEALSELEHFGIRGQNIYFIDFIPLVEMIWADGCAQEGERRVLDRYIRHHVARLNQMAGYDAFDLAAAQAFVESFLRDRPSPQLMRVLRQLVAAAGLAGGDKPHNEAARQSLLAVCLDIAASCTTSYPYGLDERFDANEKRCYFEILETLTETAVEAAADMRE